MKKEQTDHWAHWAGIDETKEKNKKPFKIRYYGEKATEKEALCHDLVWEV